MADPSTFWEVLNSEFVKSLTGSAMGAFAGAWAAQRIADRGRTREELLKEIRATNAAATIAYGMTDAFINVKRQLVKPLHDRYHERREAFLKAAKEQKPGQVFNLEADLQTLSVIKTSMGQLQQIAFEDITAPVRAISLIGVLDRTIEGLNGYIQTRNVLVEEIRQNGIHPVPYYGLPTEHGADQRYFSTLNAMYTYNDDIIHFSKMLGDDLRKYATGLKDKLPKRLKQSVKVITSADFSKAAEVMPDPSKYSDWETMFVPAKTYPRLGFWARLRRKKPPTL